MVESDCADRHGAEELRDGRHSDLNGPRRLLFILPIAAGIAQAGPITFDYAGSVTNDPFAVFGSATFTGQYTFDSNMTQVLATANSGGYAGSGGIFSMSAVFSGTPGGALDGVVFTADTLNITVNNNF